MKFTPVYYICAACPTVEKTLEMVDAYVAHGAEAFQIDMPSKDPFMETEFVKAMMKNCVADGLDYARYMDAIREMRRRYPKVTLHVVVYNDVVDSIGLDTLCNFCRESGVASLMVPGITPENFASIEARGVKVFRFIEHEMLESQVEFAANKSGAEDYVCLRNQKPGEVDKPGYDTWEKKYAYIREQGVTGMVYSVYGIHTGAELARVKATGASGAIIGNVLMRLWDDKDALWKLFAELQAAAEA